VRPSLWGLLWGPLPLIVKGTHLILVVPLQFPHCFPLALRRRMHIPHRGRNVRVSHQLLKCRKIHPGHRRPRSECVVEVIEPERRVNFCLQQSLMMRLANGPKRFIAVSLLGKLISPLGFHQPSLQNVDHRLRQGNVATSKNSFTARHKQITQLEMHILFPYVEHLFWPHSCPNYRGGDIPKQRIRRCRVPYLRCSL